MDEELIVSTVVKHLVGQHDQSEHANKRRRVAKKPHPWIAGLRVVSKAGKIRQAKLAIKYSGKMLTPRDKQNIKAQIRGAKTAVQRYRQSVSKPLSYEIVRGIINYALQNPEDVRGLVGAVGGGAKAVGGGAKKVWKKIDDPENREALSEADRQAMRKQRFWHPDTAADLDYRRNPQFYSGF